MGTSRSKELPKDRLKSETRAPSTPFSASITEEQGSDKSSALQSYSSEISDDQGVSIITKSNLKDAVDNRDKKESLYDGSETKSWSEHEVMKERQSISSSISSSPRHNLENDLSEEVHVSTRQVLAGDSQKPDQSWNVPCLLLRLELMCVIWSYFYNH